VKPKPGRTPPLAIKLMRSDPAVVEAQERGDQARYTKLFGV